VSRSKRSKIGQFVTLVRKLDSDLKFPTYLTERAGLALVQAMEVDNGLAQRLSEALLLEPNRSADGEAQIITRTITQASTPTAPPMAEEPSRKHSEHEVLCEGLVLRVEKDGAYRLTGPALGNELFVSRLMVVLRDLGKH
jgi:ParB family chromosome partitioning protein